MPHAINGTPQCDVTNLKNPEVWVNRKSHVTVDPYTSLSSKTKHE